MLQNVTSTSISNPFPGLRPFRETESFLYFGRNKHIQTTLHKLLENRFVSIIGASGVGKSSFVFCGLVYSLMEKKFDLPVQGNWKIINTHPGDNPIGNLARNLARNTRQEAETVENLLRTSERGVAEALRTDALYTEANYLIFLDQLEEIFRYKDQGEEYAQEVEKYISLIINAFAQREVPIYVIFTMRSEFLDNCSQYPQLTEYLNLSQFLIPRMTQAEIKETIIEPVQYMGAHINEGLVERILHEISDNADQLPLMQHAMMRTWDHWQKRRVSEDQPISNADYEAVGGIQNALSVQANEIFSQLNDNEKKICEKIFKSITEKTAEGRGIRRPAKLGVLADIIGVSPAEVAKVIEPFRKQEAGLLMPSEPVELEPETVIDISHESLMRIWETLSIWTNEEADSVKLYLRLAEAAEMHQQGKTGLWRPPDLQLAQSWRDEQKPSEAWALRHHPTFDRTMLFLDYSQKEYEKEQINKEKLQKRRLAQARYVSIASVIAVIICLLFLLWAIQKGEEAAENLVIAEDNAKKAETEAKKAERAKKSAEKSAEAARQSAEIAKNEKKAADVARELAVENEKKAEAQRRLAEISRQKAVTEEAKAKKNLEMAKINEEIALINNKIAKLEKEKAELARQEAENLRMVSIAKTMALKSKNIVNDTLQPLVAQQALLLNNKFKGKSNDPDVYYGVYYAIKTLKNKQTPNFNQLNGHTANVRSLLSNNNQLFSTGSDGKILAWDLSPDYTKSSTIKPTEVQPEKSGLLNRTLAVSKDKRFMACAGEYPYVQLFDGQKLKSQLPITSKEVWYLAFNPTGDKLIAIDNAKQVLLWNVHESNPKSNAIVPSGDSKINTIAASPSQNYFAVGKENGLIELIDYQGVKVKSINAGKSPIISMAFSPDGTALATGSEDGVLSLWNSETGKIINTQKEHRARINCIVFNQTGSQLATASFDRTVRIWNASNINESPIVLDDHNDWVWSIAFSPDGQELLAGCKDNMIRVWPTQLKAMEGFICQEINNQSRRKYLTEEEWQRFIGKIENNKNQDLSCCQ
jgi:WD40 repeat protein